MRARARGGFLVVAALVVALGGDLFAEYKEQYRKGLQLIEAKKYQEAIRALRQAADENPLEGGDPVEIAGGRSEPYVPLYYIGLAYYRMGDCGRAGVTWQLAKMGGEVLDHPALARTMREYVAACEAGKTGEAKLAEPDSAPAATTAPAPAAAAANSPRVKNLLQGARGDLSAKRFGRARQRAEEALRLGADQALVDALLADLADAEKAAGTAASPAPGTTTPAGGLSAAEGLAMEAFYSLDYSRARQLLEPLAGQGSLSPRGYLYLACSYAAEAAISGHDVDAQVQRARAAYQKAQPNAKTFEADWKYISPRLRSVVEGKSQP